MEKYDVVVLTEDRYIAPTSTNDYINNVLKEDQLVLDALIKQGLNATRKSWSDPEFDWSTTKAAIFRTTWDYFDRYEEFSNWLKTTSKKLLFFNPMEQLIWNIDKHYLLDLEKRGINIPKSIFIEPESTTSLKTLQENTGWTKFILKPAISGAARHTYIIESDNIEQHEPIFQELIAKESMMIQPFLENILSKGEISLMLMGGKYTHAVIKKAKAGDFRVQDDFGGSVEPYSPNEEEIAFAEKAFAACKTVPTYGRADIVWDNEGNLAISELELIEPELWFRFYPEAANKLAFYVKNQLLKVTITSVPS